MIVRSTFALFLICILFLHTINAINPAYFRQNKQEEQLASIIDAISKQLEDQHLDLDLSEKTPNTDDDEDDDQVIKRSKYPNFHVSPLWLSRRTRTNRFYGKPLWISRTG